MSVLTKTKDFIWHEFRSVLPPTIYFIITFNIVVLTTSLVLEEYNVHTVSHASATVLALFVAKIVLVVDKIPFIRRFDHKPLAYPILFKATSFSVFVALFRLLEYWMFGEDITWLLFAVSQIWIFVLFIFYFVVSELISAFRLSRPEVLRIFFLAHPHSLDGSSFSASKR